MSLPPLEAVGVEVLSAGTDADLVVLGKLGRSLPGLQRSGSTVRTLLMQRRGIEAVFKQVVSYSPSDLAPGIQRAGKGPVVIPCSRDWLDGESLCGLVDEIDSPILLIR